MKDLIDRWRKQGLINDAQATQMLADVAASPSSAPSPSSRAPTWVLFVAALLNGVVLYVYSWVYGIEVVAHETMGLWVLCLMPLVYVLRRSALTALFSLLVAGWTLLFVYRDLGAIAVADRLIQLPVTLLLAGLALFSLGGLHYLGPGMRSVARPMRIVGIQLALVALFALTIEHVADGISLFNELRDSDATAQVTFTLVSIAAIAAAATVIGVVVRARAPSITRVEAPVTLSLIGASLAYLFLPLSGDVFALLFTIVLAALGAALFYVGFKRGDARVLRIGGLTLGILIAVRVADFMSEGASMVGVVGVAAGILAASIVAVELLRRRVARPAKQPAAPVS